MMIKAIIIIIILIFIAYGILELLYRMYVRDRQNMENDILHLEQRLETYKLEMYGRINAIKYNIPDNLDIDKLKKEGKKK